MNTPLPPHIGKPATRALNAAGITNLEQLITYKKTDVANLHGVGPKALGILQEALRTINLDFASESKAKQA